MTLKVAELFAGVGGFRYALERIATGYKVVWSNQWEPGRRKQHASECYVRKFGEPGHHCVDINTIAAAEIPDDVDLLVGGFPCQDYSRPMATRTDGINGEKGALWWQIAHLLSEKRPRFALLENVDLLLRSPARAPADRRGRDFGLVLGSLHNCGYSVEWRVINAADYGYPQKRRRVFLFAARHETAWGRIMAQEGGSRSYFETEGFFAREFSGSLRDKETPIQAISIDLPRQELEDNFRFDFQNSGVMTQGVVWTARIEPVYNGRRQTLQDVLQPRVEEKYYVADHEIQKWDRVKDRKERERITKDGYKYTWKEGKLPFPDPTDSPSRTITTSEGGRTPTRSKHVILEGDGRYRRLTPVEVERLNGFPDNWTAGMPEGWRYYCMGNALVTGLIGQMGKTLMIPEERLLADVEEPPTQPLPQQPRR